jgi:hypothetical protein
MRKEAVTASQTNTSMLNKSTREHAEASCMHNIHILLGAQNRLAVSYYDESIQDHRCQDICMFNNDRLQ